MKRSSSGSAERAGLIAVAVALAAGIAATAARLRNRSSASARRPRDQTYTCRCGTRYRVSGADRHRVYWPADAADGAPVMGDRCVRCDAPLPAGRATAAA